MIFKMKVVAIHAIGDRVNDLILDMYASVASENQMKDHIDDLGSNMLNIWPRPGLLHDSRGRILSIQFKSLLANNAQLAFGSDRQVADINPLRSIATAMKRMPPSHQLETWRFCLLNFKKHVRQA
nr:protein LONG AFTER FAR-RED 3 isoform X2 [Ipomoea batatas]